MKYFSLVVIAFAFHTNWVLGKPTTAFDENFNSFLRNALEKYPAWIRDNNLVPSPPLASVDNLRINKEDIQLTCTLSDEQIVGYTNQSNLFIITDLVTLVEIEWIILGFDYNAAVTFQGKYNASGTINTDVPLNGNGSWIYTSNRGIHEGVNIIYSLGTDGYIHIYDDYYLHNVYPLDESDDEIYFEGLWDDEAAGNAELIRESVRTAYLNRLGDTETRDPTRNLLFQYLREIFQETPYEDIIRGN